MSSSSVTALGGSASGTVGSAASGTLTVAVGTDGGAGDGTGGTGAAIGMLSDCVQKFLFVERTVYLVWLRHKLFRHLL